MPDLLLELFSEEIPASMQKQAARQLQTAMVTLLTKHTLTHDSVITYVTPRRLALVVKALPLVQGDGVLERKGPRVDAPDAAIEGFVRSVGLTREQLDIQRSPKGDFYMAVIRQQGKDVGALLVEIIQEILTNFRWPKSMRWSTHTVRWVRPLHRILCVFNQQILPVTFAHLQAANVTQGHRFMAKNRLIVINDAAEYEQKLAQYHVMADPEKRQASILEQTELLIAPLGLTLRRDDGLLQEIIGLVEHPVVLLGKFDGRFMSLPQEALVSVMRTHQKYLTLQNHRGELAPYFIAVSNIASHDEGKKIIEGFERVLTARLEDARFFWDKDRQSKLESRVSALKQVIFHAKLGTLEQKTQRMVALSKMIAPAVPHAKITQAERAAHLAKTDLITQMVGEFPELQGTMGYYYSLWDKEDKEVAEAIRDHYLPQGPADAIPMHPLGIVVALADKFDTLVGLFAAGEIPTGSKDPFALRRTALGIIRIILQHGLHLPLRPLLDKALALYPSALLPKEKGLIHLSLKRSQRKPIVDTILTFLEERLRVLLKEESISHELIMAVFDGGAEDDFTRLKLRVLALAEFLATKKGDELLSAYRRATNIVLAEEKKDGISYTGTPKEELLEQPQEKLLHAAFKTIDPVLHKALQQNDFKTMMHELAQLHEPINAFFEHVTVNSDHAPLRKNRLLLLSKFREMLHHVANVSLISVSYKV